MPKRDSWRDAKVDGVPSAEWLDAAGRSRFGVLRMWSIWPATASRRARKPKGFLHLRFLYPAKWPHTISTRLMGPDPSGANLTFESHLTSSFRSNVKFKSSTRTNNLLVVLLTPTLAQRLVSGGCKCRRRTTNIVSDME